MAEHEGGYKTMDEYRAAAQAALDRAQSEYPLLAKILTEARAAGWSFGLLVEAVVPLPPAETDSSVSRIVPSDATRYCVSAVGHTAN